MPTIDETIEATVAAAILAAIPASGAEGRKIPAVRQGDTLPKILLACAYDRESPGENTTAYKRNVFYSLLIVFYTKSNLGSTGDETLNAWRQTVARLLYGPTLAGVPEVNDFIPRPVPPAAIPPLPFGVDTQAVMYDVETYEPTA